MDLNTFGFFTETINASAMTDQMMVDFALKCYNLFLLNFYFQIMKWMVASVQRVVRRFGKFNRF